MYFRRSTRGPINIDVLEGGDKGDMYFRGSNEGGNKFNIDALKDVMKA